MQTLGLRHVALNVANAQNSKLFYTSLFGMQVEWEPDPQNIFLTSGGRDNLALHEIHGWSPARRGEGLDHIGFIMKTEADVERSYQEVKSYGAPIAKDLKKHRDGAYSFYLKDPDGYVIQVIYHPPISSREK